MSTRSSVCLPVLVLFFTMSAEAQPGPPKPVPIYQLHRESQQRYEELERLFFAERIDEAMACARRIEAIERELIDRVERELPTNKELAASFRTLLSGILHWQADRCEERDELTAALPLRKEVVALERTLHGEAHWEYADALRSLERAERLLTRSAADRKELAEARTLNRRVLRLTEQGKWTEALPLANRAVAIRKRVLGEMHFDYGTSLSNLAGLLDDLGDGAGAEPLYRQTVAINKRALGRRHPLYAQSLNNLAYLYFKMGDDARAEPLLRESLQVVRDAMGEHHPQFAAGLANLAALRHAHGDDEQAEALFRQALDITRAVFGEQHAQTALLLNNLATVAEARGDPKRAESLYRESLAIREKVLGADHPACALSLNNLAEFFYSTGDLTQAESYFERALQLQTKALGEAHPEYARTLHNLAGVYHTKGDYARAEPLYRRALAIRERALGENHPQTARSADALALLDAALGRWDEAAAFEDRARRIFRRYTGRVLPTLSEREQLSFLFATDSGSFWSALSLGLARRGDAKIAALSAGWVLNGKGAVQQALAERALLGRESRDPVLGAVVRRLQEIRVRLANAALAGEAADSQAERKRGLAALAEQEQELAREIGRARGHSDRPDRWIEPDEVRAALARGTVLVEFVRVLIFDFHAVGRPSPWSEPRYAAWLIPAGGEGDIHVVDLGPTGPIDQAVGAFRKALKDAPQVIYERGEIEAEAGLKATLEALAVRVLRPLEPLLASAPRWVVSPDSSLWLVPWGALPLEDGRYAVEAHAIRHVVSGRDLVPKTSAASAIGAGVMLADPDYDLAARPRNDADRDVASRLSTSPVPLNWPRLPGTAQEAEAILPRVERFLGVRPTLATGADAVERAVKSVRGPRVVVLSTHGFFLADQDVDRSALPALTARPSGTNRLLENPLLRCGLVLAGANQRERATDPNGDDGILTGLEIVGTDLRGADLVVLSACETGLGQVRNGEGVSGLRQSFQLAGARAVLSTLWPIPDEETVALMTPFWDAMAMGADESDALRSAQLAVIRSRRAAEHAAHPYFWAAFTLTGAEHPRAR